MKLIDRIQWWHAPILIVFASIAGNIVRELRHEHAIADRSAPAPRRGTGVARKGESGGAGTAIAQGQIT